MMYLATRPGNCAQVLVPEPFLGQYRGWVWVEAPPELGEVAFPTPLSELAQRPPAGELGQADSFETEPPKRKRGRPRKG